MERSTMAAARRGVLLSLALVALAGEPARAQQAEAATREFAAAAQLLGGYWRFRWGDESGDTAVLQVTNVVPAANVVQFGGVYSPDGLTSCETQGLLAREIPGTLRSGSATESVSVSQVLRFHVTCPTKEIAADLFGLTTPSGRVEFAGRATVSTASSSYQRAVHLSRFRAD